MKKYKLSNKTKKDGGVTLYRIVCVTAFANVSEGDLGGWVESEDNLSQHDKAWIYGDARVCGKSVVYGDARVCGNAVVCGRAVVCGNAMVCGNASVRSGAIVCDNAMVYDNAIVCDRAVVRGGAVVGGEAVVSDNARVFGTATICDDARVFGNAAICGDAVVCHASDYVVLKNFWGSCRYFTYTISNDKWSVGCFYGTGDELVKKAYSENKLKGKCYEASVKYVQEIMKLIKK